MSEFEEVISRNLDKGKKGEVTFHGTPSEQISPILNAFENLDCETHYFLEPNGKTYKITGKQESKK